MKRIIIVISVLAGLAFMMGCEKEQENPVLNLTQIAPAELVSPQGGGDYVLMQDNEEDLVFTINWNPANYIMQNLPKPRYAIELDVEGNNFANPATIATVDSLSYDLIVQRLNDVSGVLGLNFDEKATVNLRIRSFIPGSSDDLMKFSNHVSFAVTPFEFMVKPIYMLGSATLAGWTNTAALEMQHVEDATYAIVSTLTSGSNNFFKFISVLGQWAPQWGTDAGPATISDGVTIGNLVYRPDETVSDPPAIPVPGETGDYRIVADTIGLQYRVEPVAEKMYVIGDAVAAGWNAGSALEMTKVAPGKFYTIVELDGSANAALQFLDGKNQNASRWGSASEFATAQSRMVETNDAARKVKLPAVQGRYRIELDLATENYRIIKQ